MAKDGMLSLIDELAERLECNYVSDLHQKKLAGKLNAVLADIGTESYAPEMWNDALHYITGQKESYETAEEARQALTQWLYEQGK